MSESTLTPTALALQDRAVLAVRGPDRRDFLQGLISNDMNGVGTDHVIWSALLTPQGKYLHDFHVAAVISDDTETLLLECERARVGDLLRRLRLYKLRAKAEVTDESDAWDVFAVFGAASPAAMTLPDHAGAARPVGGGVAFVDPRHAALGVRLLLPAGTGTAFLAMHGVQMGERIAFEAMRIALGVPDGSRDMAVEKAILLENGFDELGGVAWRKGCFVGQELTARTKYRGLVKKRLIPVAIDGPVPEAGTPIMAGDLDAGEMRTAIADETGGIGLALVRLEALSTSAPLMAGSARLTPKIPEWMTLQPPT